jgi:tetratricopeptide (TPR) repeat protein/DNA-binding XRE family transcriptional regulator
MPRGKGDRCASEGVALFGRTVSAHRRRAGLTQEELAARTGLSVRSIRDLESGRVNRPRPSTVRLLADAFGLAGGERETFRLATEPPPVTPPSQELPAAAPGAGRPVPAQLPPGVPGFAGRVGELRALDGRSGAVAAIMGPGGVGKTALAVHWAHRIAGEFPDGQLYVNLRGFDPSGRVMDPAEAVRGFLDALGVPPDQIPVGPDAQAARYRGLLAGRRVIVVLDNARDAEQVRPLLPGTATALVVVTSRDQLTGLLATDGVHPLALDVLSLGESRDLLVRRLGDDRVTAEPGAVREIIAACARLPLALSIAAARARQTGFPLAALAAELGEVSQRLNVLDAGDPVSDVRAVFSWSYATLSPPAAQLFRLLGLHPSPELSTAAVAALAGTPVSGVHRPLTRLVRANLLVEHSPGRYTQHDLLRAYATELTLTRDTADIRHDALSRLVAYYTHTACAANKLLYPTLDPIVVPLGPSAPGAGPQRLDDPQSAMAWLGAEHVNLLAALARAAEAELDTHTWQLAWGLDTFHYRQGHPTSQVAAWQAAVAAAGRLGNPAAQAYAHRRLGEAHRLAGQPADAYTHMREALHLFTSSDDQHGQGSVHLDLSILANQRGDLHQALDHAEQALTVARSGGYGRQQARALNSVGWYQAQFGNHTAALALCQEALDLNLRLGDAESTSSTFDSLGYIHLQLGDHTRAAESYERAVAILRELRHPLSEADTLVSLGDTHRAAGDSGAARAAWTRALHIFTEFDNDRAQDVRVRLREHTPAATHATSPPAA